MKLKIIEAMVDPTQPPQDKMCLVSKYMSATQLVAHLCGLFPDLSTKTIPFFITAQTQNFKRLKPSDKLFEAGLSADG